MRFWSPKSGHVNYPPQVTPEHPHYFRAPGYQESWADPLLYLVRCPEASSGDVRTGLGAQV